MYPWGTWICKRQYATWKGHLVISSSQIWSAEKEIEKTDKSWTMFKTGSDLTQRFCMKKVLIPWWNSETGAWDSFGNCVWNVLCHFILWLLFCFHLIHPNSSNSFRNLEIRISITYYKTHRFIEFHAFAIKVKSKVFL